jgi:hypothetical protein
MRTTIVAASLFALLFACGKPKAGESCSSGRVACQDPATELVCQDGKFMAAPCKGAKGCTVSGGTQSCDISANGAGDPCPPASEGNAACSPDKAQMVVCRSGKYQLETCRGPKGCTSAAGRVECDTSLQNEGDTCTPDESYACTVDKKKALVCKSGKFVFYTHCRGAKACERTGREVQCDRGRQEIGDPCLKAGDHECSVDEKSLLACKDGRWALDKKCKCESHDDRVGCKD